jgi:hypothetical protein
VLFAEGRGLSGLTPLLFEIDSGRIGLQPVSETACTESTLDVGTE